MNYQLRFALYIICWCFVSGYALQSRDYIRIVGSSTLYPFITLVAEHFGNKDFKVPVVEANGTGNGINLFCSGNSSNYPDIVATSRRMKDSEIEKCNNNEVYDIEEIIFGYDALVLVNSVNAKDFTLTKEDIFKAIAKQVVINEQLVENPYKFWHEINSKLPKQKILFYGPPSTSGTRESLVELTVQEHCMKLKEFEYKYSSKDEQEKACKLLRRDEAYIEVPENDSIFVHKIFYNTAALGVVSYNFLNENRKFIKDIPVAGVKPTLENITNFKYPLTKKLYLYVNNNKINRLPGLTQFLTEIKSPGAIGQNGYLTNRGFISSTSIIVQQ